MLGISTTYFSTKGLSIYDSVRKAVEMGFSHVEMGSNHDYEDGIWETLKKIRKDFKKTSFSLHAYFPPIFKMPYMFNLAEGLTDNNRKETEALFKAAQILETKIIGFHPGINNRFVFLGQCADFAGFKKFKSAGKISQKEAEENSYNAFSYLVNHGKKTGIKIAIENIYLAKEFDNDLSLTFSKKEDFEKILKEIDGLFFLLDYGHSNILQSDPDCFFSFGSKIIEIHMSDVKDGKDHRAFGTGEIDLNKLLEKFIKLPQTPLLVLEHEGRVTEEQILDERKTIDSFYAKITS